MLSMEMWECRYVALPGNLCPAIFSTCQRPSSLSIDHVATIPAMFAGKLNKASKRLQACQTHASRAPLLLGSALRKTIRNPGAYKAVRDIHHKAAQGLHRQLGKTRGKSVGATCSRESGQKSDIESVDSVCRKDFAGDLNLFCVGGVNAARFPHAFAPSG